MSEPSATSLNASQRDALFSVGMAVKNGGDAPTVREARTIGYEFSERFSEDGSGRFYDVLGDLDDMGYVTRAPNPDDARTKVVGLTVDGEEALRELAERSDDIARSEEP